MAILIMVASIVAIGELLKSHHVLLLPYLHVFFLLFSKKENLGPGTYEYKDFLELQEGRPHSTRGIINTGEMRFKGRIRVGTGSVLAEITCLKKVQTTRLYNLSCCGIWLCIDN